MKSLNFSYSENTFVLWGTGDHSLGNVEKTFEICSDQRTVDGQAGGQVPVAAAATTGQARNRLLHFPPG